VALLELTNLVSPKGHDHPEIAEKIGEVQDNLRRFAEAFGRSLLELRREIETESLRKNVDEVLEKGGASQDVRDRVQDRIADLATRVQSDTPLFTQKLSTAGTVLLNAINDMAISKGAEADQFLADPSVQELTNVARQYTETGTQTRPESELLTYQRTTTVTGGKKLTRAIK